MTINLKYVGLVTRVQLQRSLEQTLSAGKFSAKRLVQEAMIDAPQFYYAQNLFKVSEEPAVRRS
jgi:hypothetical protein